MKILSTSFTGDAQLVGSECYVVGAELNDVTGDAYAILYNEASSAKTAAQIFLTLRVCDETQCANLMFPLPGLKCDGVYVDWNGTSAVGTLYYYY